MAAETYADIQPALAQTMAPLLVRAWNRSSELLSRVTIMAGGGQGNGQNVAWNVQFSGAAADTFAEGSDVGGGELTHDVEKTASLGWGRYRSAFQLSDTEIDIANANMGNARELENLLEERLFDAVAVITSKINQDMIAGTGTGTGGNPTIVGAISALAATGSYAGLNKATYSQWAGNVNANGGILRPLSLDILSKAEQSAFVASGASQDVLISTAGILTKYEGLFNAVQRVITQNGPITRLDGSSETLYWRGKPLVRDKDMSAGYLLGLRSAGIELRFLPAAPLPAAWQPMTMRELISTNGDQQKALGAFIKVTPLARTGSAVKFMAQVHCQAKFRRTNEHFVVGDISEV